MQDDQDVRSPVSEDEGSGPPSALDQRGAVAQSCMVGRVGRWDGARVGEELREPPEGRLL